MTWRTILTVAVFIGMCGFIAYWGDILGRRMGKRRLTLFGLRPRYTAIVTTTITGMLIAILTIAFMATVSEKVRVLMLEGEKILRERSILISERESARKAADEAKADIQRITADLDKLRVDLRRNKAALADTEKQLADAKLEVSAAKREIAQHTEKIATQRADIEDLEKRRSVLLQNLSVLWEDMGEAAAKYQGYIALRQGRVIFRSNEELARRVISCAQSGIDIRTEVLMLLGEAGKRAQAEGAKVGKNNRAVEILAKKVETDDPSKEPFLKESASLDAIVDQISSGSGTVVARIISIGNSVEGEQALIDFVLNYNRLVYSSGQEVARAVINGRASQGQVLGQVVHFLRTEVRPAAIGKGIIPYYDKEQDQPTVGQISPDQLLDIVDRVKAAGKQVTLIAIAKADTWSAGPLDLDFRMGVVQ